VGGKSAMDIQVTGHVELQGRQAGVLRAAPAAQKDVGQAAYAKWGPDGLMDGPEPTFRLRSACCLDLATAWRSCPGSGEPLNVFTTGWLARFQANTESARFDAP
jgi:hypothetical protein